MMHDKTEPNPRDAGFFVLGLMDDHESQAFKAAIDSDPSLLEEVKRIREDLQLLGSIEPLVPPPAEMKAKLFQRLDNLDSEAHEPQSFSMVSGQDLPWQAGDCPGIAHKTLFNDVVLGFQTLLVRMDPGSKYMVNTPCEEELLVLQGELYGGEFSLSQGAFRKTVLTGPGKVRSSEKGCVAMVRLTGSPTLSEQFYGDPCDRRSGLTLLADEVGHAPPAGLKARLMARLDLNLVEEVGVSPQMTKAEDAWHSTPFPGLRYKALSLTETRMTLLLKMEPGHSFPPHAHAGFEETFILDGDFYGEGCHMGDWDYLWAGEGDTSPAVPNR